MIASFLLTGMKLVVGIVTGSIGIISEAAHSGLDFGVASLTYFAVKIGDKPADRDHHYGHTKVESIAALIESGILLIASSLIIYEAAQRLIHRETEVKVTWYSILVLIISIVVDFSRSRALAKVAKETKSQALEADALHFNLDIFSSAVVLGGLVFVTIGITWADAIAGIAVALIVLSAAFRLGKRTVNVLTDAAPEGITEQIIAVTKTVNGVVNIEKIRVKPAGPHVFVEMTVNVSRNLSLESVQLICSTIESHVSKICEIGDITINTKPVALDCETVAERVHIIGMNHNINVHNIATTTAEDRVLVSFDVEVDRGLTIKEAHDIVSNFEDDIRKEFNSNIDISIHIDPLPPDEKGSTPLAPEEEDDLKKIIMRTAEEIGHIYDVQNIQIRKTEKERLFISLLCSFDNSVLLDEVHSITKAFEWMILQNIPNAYRVIIHAEPFF